MFAADEPLPSADPHAASPAPPSSSSAGSSASAGGLQQQPSDQPADLPVQFDGPILVTGGTGSIGSELVRQLIAGGASEVRVFSRDDSEQALLRTRLGNPKALRLIIGDIRDRQALSDALAGAERVFHAAALKHVDLCEANPRETFLTNVSGSQNLVDEARRQGVRHFLLISTDKAVEPVSTLGSSKFLAEGLVVAAHRHFEGGGTTVLRFGNILGSRGSLLPILVEQLRRQPTIEVTTPLMTRFVLTAETAASEAIAASLRKPAGERLVIKSPALRIGDLIEVFAARAETHHEWPSGTIDIRQVGARPGERLHEQLVAGSEIPHLEDGGHLYRIATETIGAFDTLPDDCRSETIEPLSPQEIGELIDRLENLFGATGDPTSNPPVPS